MSIKSIFRNIESFDFANLETVHPEVHIENSAKIRVFSIKEKAVNKLVGIHDLSSGMQKVLLLLTDIITLPGDWIYLVDEYENSLGINAINFLIIIIIICLIVVKRLIIAINMIIY